MYYYSSLNVREIFFGFISQDSESLHWVPEGFSRVGRGASSHEKPLAPTVQRAKNKRFK